MSLWDTAKNTAKTSGGELLTTAKDTGLQLLKDEISKGHKQVPEVRPDIATQPAKTVTEAKAPFKLTTPMIIGGSIAVGLAVFFLMRKK